nr:YvcK family protein [Acidimicrobiia bacterium]
MTGPDSLPLALLQPVAGEVMGPSVACVGGGHGLAQVLKAVSAYAGSITAVVNVADDGGSSG